MSAGDELQTPQWCCIMAAGGAGSLRRVAPNRSGGGGGRAGKGDSRNGPRRFHVSHNYVYSSNSLDCGTAQSAAGPREAGGKGYRTCARSHCRWNRLCWRGELEPIIGSKTLACTPRYSSSVTFSENERRSFHIR